MDFPPLIRAQLLRRYKRFLADFRLADGREVTAHCANPGSMKSIVEHRPEGWLSRARPGRKLSYTWELAVLPPTDQHSQAEYVYVNPVGANRLVAEALESRVIPDLADYDIILPEVRYGTNSRIDFLLQGSPGKAYVEVKNLTLKLESGEGAFPDSVTARGTKHLRELMKVVDEGHRAVLIFCVSRNDVHAVRAAFEIDPEYARTLKEAIHHGVEVKALGGTISERQFSLTHSVPFIPPSHG